MLEFVFGTLMFATPILLIWGWVRWAHSPRSQNVWSALSWVGFLCATTSAALAIVFLLLSLARPFLFYPALATFTFLVSLLLVISGMVAALAGTWKPGPLRWHAPLCVAGNAVFWLILAASYAE